PHRRRPHPGGGLLRRDEEKDRPGRRAAARSPAAGAGRAVRSGRPGQRGADPRHPRPVRRRRRDGHLLQPRHGGGGTALQPRGDPGRRGHPHRRSPRPGARWTVTGGGLRADRRGPYRHRGRTVVAVRPVAAVSPFVRLKLRMLANGLRGRTWRVLLFIGGTLLGAYLGGMGFLLFAASAAGDAQVRLMVASFGGAALVLGSVLLPLVWFGVDDTLDPARFALLPLPRTRLVLGLLAAALVSVPAAALLLATAGLLVPAGVAGGPAAVVAQAVGLLAGLVLCVAAGRAVVSAFATMLRSRRVRDLAGILLAALAALLGPIQLGVVAAAQSADWDQLTRIARVVGWTPLAGAYTVGIEVAEGRPLAALAKLLVVAASVAGLLWWWSRTLESAQVGAASAG